MILRAELKIITGKNTSQAMNEFSLNMYSKESLRQGSVVVKIRKWRLGMDIHLDRKLNNYKNHKISRKIKYVRNYLEKNRIGSYRIALRYVFLYLSFIFYFPTTLLQDDEHK